MLEYVYARHDFIPEHEDEISFRAGERIEIVEKDELYGDGWWKVCSRSPLSISPHALRLGFAGPVQLSASSFLSRGCSRADLTPSITFYAPHTVLYTSRHPGVFFMHLPR
jgi:hypothetical protein